MHRAHRLLWLTLLLAAFMPACGRGPLPPLDGEPSMERFKPYVGERFTVLGGQAVQGAAPVAQLELVEVEDAGSNAQLSQFTLRFKAVGAASLPRSIYTLEHAGGASVRLFVEPAGTRLLGTYFESRFSLLRGFDPAKAPHRPAPRH